MKTWRKFHLLYTLIDSFTANPYGIVEKYDLPQTTFQHDFKNLEEQLGLLQAQDWDLMFPKHFPQNLNDLKSPHSDCLHEWTLKEG